MKKANQLYIAIVFIYLYVPIAVLIINAFNANRYGLQWDGFTLGWFQAMLNNHSLIEAARNSLLVAVSSATIATMIGALGAVAMYFHRFKGRKVVFGTIISLMMLPDIILAIALLVLFIILGLSLGFWSLLLAHITFCLPFTFVTVFARMQGFDPYLIEAARDLGASEGMVLRTIVFPLISPALIASWLLGFTLSLDDVIVSSFVAGPGFDVLPLRIFSMVKVGVKPEVNALAFLMILISIIFVATSYFLLKEKAHEN
jgi:spermidine/putrescine transport system permease protein